MWHSSEVPPVRLSAPIAVLSTILAGCSAPEERKDRTPPEFDGLDSVEVVSAGTALLSWEAADDPSEPLTYRVWVAREPGTQLFDGAPVAETQSTSVQIAGLPTGTAESWFVVRAVDARGNIDANVAERGVSFAENRLELLGSYVTPIASDIAVHASNDLVAMGAFSIPDPGDQVRAWLFDVSDPADPELVSTILGEGRSTDVEIRGDVLWVATEFDPDDHGAYAYDISNPALPVELGSIGGPGLGSCHTIWLDGDILYCASSDDGSIRLVDVSDPASPDPRGTIVPPDGRVHDMYVGNGIAVGCFLSHGWAFLDVSDPDDPTIGSFVQYSGAATHNAWPSEDGQFLFTTDETFNGRLRVWDIADRGAPVQVAEYVADPGSSDHAIVHNVQVQGNFAYLGWYEAGVIVLDVTDPTAPLLAGWYDSYPFETVGTFAGAWSAAPKGDKVYVSDFSSGLYVLHLGTSGAPAASAAEQP